MKKFLTLATLVATLFLSAGCKDTREHPKHQNAIKKWLLQKKNEWNQETIGYEFESDLYYI